MKSTKIPKIKNIPTVVSVTVSVEYGSLRDSGIHWTLFSTVPELSVVGPSVERLTPAHATSGVHAEANRGGGKGKLEVSPSIDGSCASSTSTASSIRSRSSFKKKGKQGSTRERSPAMPGSNRGSRDPTPVPGDARRDQHAAQESHKVTTNFIPYKMGEDGRTCYYSGLFEMTMDAFFSAVLLFRFPPNC